MALRTKIISSITLVFAIGAFSVFASAQSTSETPNADANKAEKHERKGFGKRDGKFGRRGGRGMMGRHGMRGGMGMFRGIELTDAQKEQIKALRMANKPSEETMALMKSVRETRKAGGTVSEDQKAQLKQLRDARREKAQAMHTQIMGILTPEQKAQLDARKAEMKQKREQWKEKRQEMREKRKSDAKPAEVN